MEIFAITTSSKCAQDLAYGPCNGAPTDGKLCTDVGNSEHQYWTQEFSVDGQLQFTIDWNFQSGPKTLKDRFTQAESPQGEEVVWTVTAAAGKDFGGATSATKHAIWRFSDTANTAVAFGGGSDSCCFSEDDGIWGAAYTDGSTHVNGDDPGPHLGNANGAWGHQNFHSDDSECAEWFANGVSSYSSNIRSVMKVSAGPVLKAAGDPHLVNMFGQRFDIFQDGRHVLLQIPMGAVEGSSLFVVTADTQKSGGACSELYFRSLNVTGKWADEVQEGGYQFFADRPTKHVGTGWMRFRSIGLKVVWGRTSGGIEYLNVFARHLRAAGQPVGGLLGEDDHSGAATPNRWCKHLTALAEDAKP